jgi:DNA-binding LacI/PurR family transcriptional regulator
VLTAVKALIRLHPSMTALVVHNDAALGWVTGCLRASGRSVPRDVAVIAICPDELAERMSTPLTSVRLPVEQLGARAVELLMCRLAGREVVSPVLLQPDLVVRASTPGAAIGHR